MFIQKTGVDALAVSIGTAHGVYSSKPTINFSLAEELVKTLDVPIVVHGGSNTPDEDIIRLCKLGVAKINIGTDLMQAYNDGILNAFQEHGKSAPLRVVMGQAREYVKATAKHKIDLLRTFARD
ncbi:class II fructose-bisphosphate aldolase [Treponema sp. SP13]